MQIELGILNQPVIFVYQTKAGYDYEVEIKQQENIDYEFDHFLNLENVEDIITDRIDNFKEIIILLKFSFFTVHTSSFRGEAFYQVSGFNVTIRSLEEKIPEQDDANMGIFGFEAFIDQLPDGSL